MASNFLLRGLSFLLIPLYATYFTTSEFGAMDMIYQLAIALSLLTSFGLPQGLVRGFYLSEEPPEKVVMDVPHQKRERKKLLGALFTFLLPISLITTLGLHVFADFFSTLLFQNEGKTIWIKLGAWLYLAMIFQALPLQLFKTLQRSKAFTTWSLITFGLVALGNLYLIIALKLGLNGMLLGNLIGTGVTAAFMLWIILPNMQINWEWKRLAPLFAFGLPMLPNLLSRKVLEIANRYMLPHWHGLSEVGLFSMGARVASIIDILVLVPFLYAWQPFFYSLSQNVDAPKIFARITHYFFLLLCTFFLVLQICQTQILHFMGRGKFDLAEPVIIFLVLAAVFNGLQYCVSAGIHLRKKLVAEMLLMVLTAVLNLVLNFLLIPRYGSKGAAASTALAYLFFLIASYLLAQKFYRINYLWNRSLFILTVSGATFIAMQNWKSPLQQILLICLFVCIGPGWDLWRHGEMKLIWTSIKIKIKL